jgi:hypothetical protein
MAHDIHSRDVDLVSCASGQHKKIAGEIKSFMSSTYSNGGGRLIRHGNCRWCHQRIEFTGNLNRKILSDVSVYMFGQDQYYNKELAPGMVYFFDRDQAAEAGKAYHAGQVNWLSQVYEIDPASHAIY